MEDRKGSSRGPSSWQRRLSLFSSESVQKEPVPDDETEVDWQLVLCALQREKKRQIARHAQEYMNRSLFCLESSSIVRQMCINIVEFSWCNRFIVVSILCNCVFLVLEDPICYCAGATCSEAELFKQMLYDRWSCAQWNDHTRPLLEISEIFFAILFTLEMILKIVAHGFILHKHAYLRNSWNWIDFIVIITSNTSLLTTAATPEDETAADIVKILRTVRVLRPLRIMTRIAGMKPLIATLIKSFKNLWNVLLLLLFFFVVYGILGLEFFAGRLRGRCFFDPVNNDFSDSARSRLESQQIPFIAEFGQSPGTRFGGVSLCSIDPSFGGTECSPAAIDGVFYDTVCSSKKWCQDGWCANHWMDNPFDLGRGFISYDNIGTAILAIFQTLTLEEWVDLMYMYQEGSSVWVARLFHSSWVIIGSFFVVQLALAVLADTFVQAQEEIQMEKEREALHDEAIIKPNLVEQEQRKKDQMQNEGFFARVLNSKGRTPQQTRTRMDIENSRHPTDVGMMKSPGENAWALICTSTVWVVKEVRTRVRQLVTSKAFGNIIMLAIMLNTVIFSLDRHDQALYEDQICKRRCDIDPSLPAGIRQSCHGPLFNITYQSDSQGGGERPQQLVYCFLENDGNVQFAADSRYKPSACSTHTSESECIIAIGGTGERCYWFPSTYESREPGVCKMPLYDSTNFAEAAEVGEPGRTATLSLRQICGDSINAQCQALDNSQLLWTEQVNLWLTGLFVVEMLLKWTGLGLADYFAERSNQFDFIVVTSSIVEIVVTGWELGNSSNGAGGGGAISSFRAMRLFRLFKLARSWKSMQRILKTLAIALGNLLPLTIMWIMFMYIFALLSMQIFGGKFKFVKTEEPRSNFDTFFPSSIGHGAFMVIFQIISTEAWNQVLYNTIIFDGQPMNSLVTIAVVMFGNYFIMNLFISILLQGFDSDENEESTNSLEPEMSNAQRMINGCRVMLGLSGPVARVRTNDMTQNDTQRQLEALAARGQKQQVKDVFEEPQPKEDRGNSKFVKIIGPFKREIKIPDHKAMHILAPTNPFRIFIVAIVQHPLFESMILISILITSIILIIEDPHDEYMGDVTACPQPPNFLNCSGLPFGQTEQINCAREALDEDFGRVWEPCDSTNKDLVPSCCMTYTKLQILATMDGIFTVIFLCEMILKLIADGVVFHDLAYFRNSWNLLDFSIVVISMISLLSNTVNLKSLKSLRTVRTLRPLRIIKRNPGLKVAVECLLQSVPAMMNVGVVVLVWFSMYAMLGMQLFKGHFYRCQDLQNQIWLGGSPVGTLNTATPEMSGAKSVPTIIECVNSGGGLGVWVDRSFSFNSYPQGLLTLFEMATTEGLMDMMAAMVDSLGPGVTPIPNSRPHLAWFCAFHIVVGTFVLLNLTVGTIINNYNRVKNRNNGITPFTTPEQQEWKETRRIISQLEPRKRTKGPSNVIRNLCFRLLQKRLFEMVITFVIVCNVITLMMKTHDQDDCTVTALFWCNVVFIVVFVSEAVIKLLGLGPRWYFLDPWNLFDFAVLVLSGSTLVLDAINGDWFCAAPLGTRAFNFSGLSILRVFRIVRVLRLVRQLKGLRQMIETLIVSMPSLSNIAALLVLFLTIFSIVGETFFYNVNLSQDAWESMDDLANYAVFDVAMWTLHRQTTGEAWNYIMFYCSQSDPYRACAKAYGPFFGNGCGSPLVGMVFHLSWQLFGTYVLMQLFTAVILENFSELVNGVSSVLPAHKLAQFVDVWTEFDPDACQHIGVDKIPELILKLPLPLGLKDKNVSKSMLMDVIKDLAIPIREGNQVSYTETFVACIKRVMNHDIEEDEDEETTKRMSVKRTSTDGDAEGDTSAHSSQNGVPVFRWRRFTVAEEFAAKHLQSAYREWREQRIQVHKGMERAVQIQPQIVQ